jgi:hypothetical protein
MAEFFDSLLTKYPRLHVLFANVFKNNPGKFQDEETRFDEIIFAAFAEVQKGVQEFADKILPYINRISMNLKDHEDSDHEFRKGIVGQIDLIHEAIEEHEHDYANTNHNHTIANITNLQSSLDSKANTFHFHNEYLTSSMASTMYASTTHFHS